MDSVTRCVHCGQRLIPTLSPDGRTVLTCMWCDNVDPMKTEAAKWADSPLAEEDVPP
jgi:hypothetical protein